MPFYRYTAINRMGKRVRDSVEAVSLESAKRSLRTAGLVIVEIKAVGILERDISLPFLGNPNAKDMTIFCRQFQSILRAGMPVVQVLAMLSQQTENRKLTAAIRDMQASIEKGETLADSMGKYPQIFSGMLVHMVAAGEASGNLVEAFRQMEIWFDKAQRTKAAVSKAMIYPCVVLLTMVAVLIVMMTTIIPSFLETFQQMDMALPGVTLAVMAVSRWFAAHWYWAVALLMGLVLGGICFSRTENGQYCFGWLARKLPVVRLMTVRSASATFCRTLALLLGSGLPLTDSLALVALNMRNIYFREAVKTVCQLVCEGWPMHTALRGTGLFPPMVCNLVGIGEETGEVPDMLEKAAAYYEEEVQDATARLLAMLEPAIMLLLAVFVLLLVLAIFLPMMQMTQAYDKYL